MTTIAARIALAKIQTPLTGPYSVAMRQHLVLVETDIKNLLTKTAKLRDTTTADTYHHASETVILPKQYKSK